MRKCFLILKMFKITGELSLDYKKLTFKKMIKQKERNNKYLLVVIPFLNGKNVFLKLQHHFDQLVCLLSNYMEIREIPVYL